MIVSDEKNSRRKEMERQLITGIAADKNEAKVIADPRADRPGAVASIFGRWPPPTSTST
jgi:aspartate kinase